MKCIIGKKVGMTTLYHQQRGALSMTMVECAPNVVSLKRNEERDGYEAVQLSAPLTAKKQVKKEFKADQIDLEEKAEVSVNIFAVGDRVQIIGTTKGKGFQGVVKRHGFSGSPATHGHRHDERAPGSIGSAYPQHVLKGKRMAGRMGSDQHTTKNVEIIFIDEDKDLVGVRGAVPGIPGGIITIQAD